jgi:hypothetical protein
MNNRRVNFSERPTANVGNNNNKQKVVKIKEYLSSCEDNEADFHSIWIYVNENTRNGVISYALSNILAKRKEFVKVGKEAARNPTTGVWGHTTIWRLVE